MATITFKGFPEYERKMQELGRDGIDKAIRFAIFRAAGMVRDEIKRAAPVDTGDLRNSVQLSRMSNVGGFIFTKIDFVGRDRKGVPNTLKANVLESGTSKRPKRPFIRKAINRIRKNAELAMQTDLDRYLYDYMRK